MPVNVLLGHDRTYGTAKRLTYARQIARTEKAVGFEASDMLVEQTRTGYEVVVFTAAE